MCVLLLLFSSSAIKSVDAHRLSCVFKMRRLLLIGCLASSAIDCVTQPRNLQRDWAAAFADLPSEGAPDVDVKLPNGTNLMPAYDSDQYVLADGGTGDGYVAVEQSENFPFSQDRSEEEKKALLNNTSGAGRDNSDSELRDYLALQRMKEENERKASQKEEIAKEAKKVEYVDFEDCEEASLRGYKPPFACCTVSDGDFFDPAIWHCGRVPTMLDAAVVKHFVRLSDQSTQAIGELRLRALWVIPGGMLRGGMIPIGLCDSAPSPPPSIINAYLETFADFEGGVNNVESLCQAFSQRKYGDNDIFKFKGKRPLFIRIEEIGGPVPTKLAMAVAMTGALGNKPTENSREERSDSADSRASADHQRAMEAIMKLNPKLFKNSQVNSRGGNSTEQDPNLGGIPPFLQQLVPSRRLQDEDENAVPPTPNFDHIKLKSPLKVSGDVVLRVEPNASFITFNNISVNVEGDLRNDGVMFVGEVVSQECLENKDSIKGLCRIPSLVLSGSLIAQKPINVLWMQLSEPRESLSKPGFQRTRKVYYYGIAQYPVALPDSYKSTLTFTGDLVIDRIVPGFSLSFRRIGFPPLAAGINAPHKASFAVLPSDGTPILVIYVDVIDADGFLDCCQELHEEYVAQFEVRGADLTLGRYASFNKEIGDSRGKVSDQIVLRAPRITSQQGFRGLDSLIPDSDVQLTNEENPPKLAGTDRDIVFFQCTEACQISNQTFKRADPYRLVQITRETRN